MTEGVMMRTKSRALPFKLAGHLAIGVAIGATLALSLLVRDLDLFKMMVYGSEPETTAVVVVGSLISLFAIGAGITGFVFLFNDEL